MNKKGMILILLICAVTGGIYLYDTRPVLSEKRVVIYTGYTKQIYLYGRYEADTWLSDHEEIAVAEDGKIKGIAPGNAVITAVSGKKKFVCEVEVREALSPKFYQIAEEEKKWFFEQQLNNGAFCNRYVKNGEVSINPYFSSLGVWCLLQCELTKEEERKIREYIQWHFEHINEEEDYNGLTGTIYDYKALIKEGEVVSESSNEKYDSTDSYSAVFLSVLWKYYKKTGDKACLVENKERIQMIANAMLSTLSKGYTYCKPDYKVVYLMDNAEVYQAMGSINNIFREVFQDENMAKEIQEIRKSLKKNFQILWWKDDHYRPYLNENQFSWNRFYADAVSQFAPIIYDLSDRKRSEEIYSEFCNHWKWEEMDYYDKKDAGFYWGMLMYGAVKMQDYERAEKYLETYRAKTGLRTYPLIMSDCAWVVLGAERLGDYYKKVEMSS